MTSVAVDYELKGLIETVETQPRPNAFNKSFGDALSHENYRLSSSKKNID